MSMELMKLISFRGVKALVVRPFPKLDWDFFNPSLWTHWI